MAGGDCDPFTCAERRRTCAVYLSACLRVVLVRNVLTMRLPAGHLRCLGESHDGIVGYRVYKALKVSTSALKVVKMLA